MSCTTVITTYNRSALVCRAIRSAFDTLPGCPVIVVDDASTDDTLVKLKKDFPLEIDRRALTIIVLSENQGVTAAKNRGYAGAQSDWVIFLDSDDQYVSGVGETIQMELVDSTVFPIVFFRCIDQSGTFVGYKMKESRLIDLKTYLVHCSFGEALVAFNKGLIGNIPPYVSELRGYEGLGCARLIRAFGRARLSNLVARIYDQAAHDRLSSGDGLRKRFLLIAKGHAIFLGEFFGKMPLQKSISYALKAILYYFLGNVYRILKR